jgi:hypothetical protein
MDIQKIYQISLNLYQKILFKIKKFCLAFIFINLIHGPQQQKIYLNFSIQE